MDVEQDESLTYEEEVPQEEARPAPPAASQERRPGTMTRRRFLVTAGAAAGGLAVGSAVIAGCSDEESTSSTAAGDTSSTAGGAGGGEAQAGTLVPLMTFSLAEARTLYALVNRIIPADENGPSAGDAGVVTYIDRSLSGDYADLRDMYIQNLAVLDEYSKSSQENDFRSLTPDRQDAVVTQLAADEAQGFTPSAAQFFGTVREHTVQGYFGDPFYGGNQNFAGWDLLNYDGIKFMYTAEEQTFDHDNEKAHKSTYEYADFGLQIQQQRG